jgi:hypothetical protein
MWGFVLKGKPNLDLKTGFLFVGQTFNRKERRPALPDKMPDRVRRGRAFCRAQGLCGTGNVSLDKGFARLSVIVKRCLSCLFFCPRKSEKGPSVSNCETRGVMAKARRIGGAPREKDSLERFQSDYALSEITQGVYFLRKMPLKVCGSGYSNSGTGPRAKPESLCPVESCVRSPLPDGRVDLNTLLSGYTNSGFALVPNPPENAAKEAKGAAQVVVGKGHAA